MMKEIRAKKSLGQHFLTGSGIPQRIGNLLKIEKDDNIIEIGPGPGALTRILAAAIPNALILLEKDKYWAEQSARNYQAQTLLTDALSFTWNRLQNLGTWKITGNLPYNIASPLIWEIISQTTAWTKCVFMIQKEVAQRICAKPGNKTYGALSVWVQQFATSKLEFYVPPGAFNPPPKVDSAVVSFLPKSNLLKFPHKLKKLLAICFQNRRKQLGNIFNRVGLSQLEENFTRLEIKPSLRPENLNPEQFRKLSEFLPD